MNIKVFIVKIYEFPRKLRNAGTHLLVYIIYKFHLPRKVRNASSYLSRSIVQWGKKKNPASVIPSKAPTDWFSPQIDLTLPGRRRWLACLVHIVSGPALSVGLGASPSEQRPAHHGAEHRRRLHRRPRPGRHHRQPWGQLAGTWTTSPWCLDLIWSSVLMWCGCGFVSLDVL